ncbi:MAG: ABC transporter ATP-binding protein, partial [Herpetosiphonaceae bacterium]|nr:ABC transporter ATP-binding protein [Herpetosiphonaceae bacterium]
MTTISLSHIHKSFGRTKVLDDITLEAPSGALIALLGPSGSGKSTILKLIAGIEPPDQGDICLDGVSILRLPAHRRNTVLMFQNAYLFPFLNVADNIAFGLRARHVAKAEIRRQVGAMLDLVELPGIERRYPQQLSGGQQQRVALARALVVQPRVLMLDEPLSNLDPAIRRTLQSVIRRIQREFKITTVLVTHDLSEAIALSDRTAVLLDGRIAAYGPPEAIFSRPPTSAAARFVGVSLLLAGRLDGDRHHSALGVLQVAVHSAAARPATFAIRPENLRLVAEAGPNTLAGTVEERVYRGEFVEYQVSINRQRVRVKSYAAALFSP